MMYEVRRPVTDGPDRWKGRMFNALLVLWWFAVLQNGQALFFEYRDEASCKIVQRAYARTGLVVTTCQPKGKTSPETSGQSNAS